MLTGTQVMLLVASETGHVYTFATRKLQPIITSDSGKELIQACLSTPDPPSSSTNQKSTSSSKTTLQEAAISSNRQLDVENSSRPDETTPSSTTSASSQSVTLVPQTVIASTNANRLEQV